MKKTTSIVFTGDIGFDRYMDRKWEDPELLSQEVLDFFHSADHVCANVEGALIDAVDDGSRGVFFHSMNPEATVVLKAMHADIWSIGNNHTMDAGAEGVISTKKIAKEQNRIALFEKRYNIFQFYEKCISFSNALKRAETLEEMQKSCNFSFENFVQNFSEPDSFGRQIPIPWTEEELDKFRKDPNYFFLGDLEDYAAGSLAIRCFLRYNMENFGKI